MRKLTCKENKRGQLLTGSHAMQSSDTSKGSLVGAGTPVALQATSIVLRRPQFRLVGNELFFLVSRRPYARLSPIESAMWAALDDGPSIAKLRSCFTEGTDRVLRRLIELGICEIAETSYLEGRRRVLVFEPHSDDAVLSVGGTMWLRRRECEFEVVTVGSRSNFTSYYYLDRDYFNVDEISSLRNAEGALFTCLLGGQHRALDQPEATLRYHDGDWPLDWYRRHRESISAFIDHHSGPVELRTWTEAIRIALRDSRAAEIWFPLGSPHTDHQLTRDALLALLHGDAMLFEGREVYFYQDVPYAVRNSKFTSTVVDALTRAGAVLVPEVVSVTSTVNEKRHLVSLYASQFKLDAIWPDVEDSARQAHGNGGLAERLWHLKNPPTTANPQAFRADAPIVRQATKQLSRWVSRNRNAERVRLLLLVPAGRWAEDMEYLLRILPMAHIDAYVSLAAAAEVVEFESPRISLHYVGAGAKAWVLLAFRLILMRPMPTIFLGGEKRLREARFLSWLWPLADCVVISTMDHLVSALRRLACADLPSENT
jgi:LmbE family N-acetylglucosaminyl deacetylase